MRLSASVARNPNSSRGLPEWAEEPADKRGAVDSIRRLDRSSRFSR
jgi:hypothetical protein